LRSAAVRHIGLGRRSGWGVVGPVAVNGPVPGAGVPIGRLRDRRRGRQADSQWPQEGRLPQQRPKRSHHVPTSPASWTLITVCACAPVASARLAPTGAVPASNAARARVARAAHRCRAFPPRPRDVNS
jgi:hypothetical protein